MKTDILKIPKKNGIIFVINYYKQTVISLF